jgi:hypothetical protein
MTNPIPSDLIREIVEYSSFYVLVEPIYERVIDESTFKNVVSYYYDTPGFMDIATKAYKLYENKVFTIFSSEHKDIESMLMDEEYIVDLISEYEDEETRYNPFKRLYKKEKMHFDFMEGASKDKINKIFRPYKISMQKCLPLLTLKSSTGETISNNPYIKPKLRLYNI